MRGVDDDGARCGCIWVLDQLAPQVGSEDEIAVGHLFWILHYRCEKRRGVAGVLRERRGRTRHSDPKHRARGGENAGGPQYGFSDGHDEPPFGCMDQVFPQQKVP